MKKQVKQQLRDQSVTELRSQLAGLEKQAVGDKLAIRAHKQANLKKYFLIRKHIATIKTVIGEKVRQGEEK